MTDHLRAGFLSELEKSAVSFRWVKGMTQRGASRALARPGGAKRVGEFVRRMNDRADKAVKRGARGSRKFRGDSRMKAQDAAGTAYSAGTDYKILERKNRRRIEDLIAKEGPLPGAGGPYR